MARSSSSARGEILEPSIGLRIPIPAVAMIAFDFMKARVQPAKDRIGFILLRNRMRAIPVAFEREYDAAFQIVRSRHSFHPLARNSHAGHVPQP